MCTDASHGVVQHDILASQLQQHRVVEELVDGDVLRETFPPSCFHHELTCLKTKDQFMSCHLYTDKI